MHVCRCFKQQDTECHMGVLQYITYTCTVCHSINTSMLLGLEDLKVFKIQQQQPEMFFFTSPTLATKLCFNGCFNWKVK